MAINSERILSWAACNEMAMFTGGNSESQWGICTAYKHYQSVPAICPVQWARADSKNLSFYFCEVWIAGISLSFIDDSSETTKRQPALWPASSKSYSNPCVTSFPDSRQTVPRASFGLWTQLELPVVVDGLLEKMLTGPQARKKTKHSLDQINHQFFM